MVWLFFNSISPLPDGHNRARCLYCNQIVLSLKGSTTGMLGHLERKHGEYKDFVSSSTSANGPAHTTSKAYRAKFKTVKNAKKLLMRKNLKSQEREASQPIPVTAAQSPLPPSSPPESPPPQSPTSDVFLSASSSPIFYDNTADTSANSSLVDIDYQPIENGRQILT